MIFDPQKRIYQKIYQKILRRNCPQKDSLELVTEKEGGQAGSQPLCSFSTVQGTHSVGFEVQSWRVGWGQTVGSMKAVELG